MTVRVWRLSDDRFAATMWTGTGARLTGGRWNGKGVAVAYASANRSLAALEQLVHLIPPRLLGGYGFSSLELDGRQVEMVDPARLPPGWDAAVAGRATQAVGDAWVASGRSLALAVPSIVIRGETNYLINPAHPDFANASRSPPEPFAHDPRLS